MLQQVDALESEARVDGQLLDVLDAGSRPPGKISFSMNFMNFRSLMVTLIPLSRKNFCVWARMVCNNIRPSAGSNE